MLLNYSQLLTSNQSLELLLKCHLSRLNIFSPESDGHCLLTVYLITQYNIIIEPNCMGISNEIKILMITIDAWVTILEIKAQSLYQSNKVWQC